jgi:hypothetical protein
MLIFKVPFCTFFCPNLRSKSKSLARWQKELIVGNETIATLLIALSLETTTSGGVNAVKRGGVNAVKRAASEVRVHRVVRRTAVGGC